MRGFFIMFYVYILRSVTLGIFYVGFTRNLEQRTLQHNLGLSRFTRGRGPWELKYFESYTSATDALKRERFFKSGKGREILKELIRG